MATDIDLVALCEQFPCSPEAKALAAQHAKASEFITALRQEKLSVDAVQAMARSLPKEKAVEWAAQSARTAGEQAGLTPAEQETLEAVDQWVARPDRARKTVVSTVAAELPTDSPVSCVANATAFSDGIALPEGAEVPTSGDDLTGHFVASAVLLAATKISSQNAPELPATPESPEIPDVPEAPDIAELPEAIGLMPEEASMPVDELVATAESSLDEGQDLMESQAPPEIPAKEQAQSDKLLKPFLDAGMKLAETVPGFV
ncbi:DUF6931 family protein [Desulfosarcina ovata]|uniref:Uncharacterized protein n=1 Tax=Desulfosarcina ovata subsp. ovata TaxID=2752305 RepID=A0A5K8A9P7_9BACT|nr:hypothetical protein [Desulfosarcina ovata]BBO88760.1 hypothetical protein DSCOOX_19400 [Desulfosarcina ovata subsp. ovata]